MQPMQPAQRLKTLKTQYDSLSGNPLMDSTGGLSGLQTQLNTEQALYNSTLSQYNNLSTQLSQAKNNLTNSQNSVNNVQSKITAQQRLVQKVHSYLSDYQESQPQLLASNDELAERLIGELQQLNNVE